MQGISFPERSHDPCEQLGIQVGNQEDKYKKSPQNTREAQKMQFCVKKTMDNLANFWSFPRSNPPQNTICGSITDERKYWHM